MSATLLIADDEKNIRSSLTTTFRMAGYTVLTVEDGERALHAVRRGGIDLALFDLQMPNMDGLEALRRLREEGFDLPVVFLSAHGSIEAAVEAVRLGAYDFVEKPPHADKLLLVVRNALHQVRLEEENRELREAHEAPRTLIGDSAPMRELDRQLERVAAAPATVLVLGEHGTGKELVARAIHDRSSRADGPYVALNCAAIPRELFESELFGHETGAFTGATDRRRGKFRRADGGTLFLDEIGEIPIELQPKLLRVLETGEVEPLGADATIEVDVRVVAATNRDLERLAADGAFREDLRYRLDVVRLEVPPLRARPGDVPALARHFAERARREGYREVELEAAALDRLQAHSFPGNVRELRNLVERLIILAPGERIGADDVERVLAGAPTTAGAGGAPALRGTLRETLHDVERELVLATVEAHGWRMTEAAAALGLERSHLYKKLRALGIERPDERR